MESSATDTLHVTSVLLAECKCDFDREGPEAVVKQYPLLHSVTQ